MNHDALAWPSNRTELGWFLRRRREALSPEAVGLPADVSRRRTPGLRRAEVAELAGISTNYYERLEQGRGPYPSPSVAAAIARAMRLSTDERCHLYRLAGHPSPGSGRFAGPDPDLVTLLAELQPTSIAQIVDGLGTVIAQNSLSQALFGLFAGRPGRGSNMLWRWFTDPQWRDARFLAREQEGMARAYAADLRASVDGRAGHDADELIRDLHLAAPGFSELWARHEVRALRSAPKVLLDPRGRSLQLECAVARGRITGQRLLIFRPCPGTDTAGHLRELLPLNNAETY